MHHHPLSEAVGKQVACGCRVPGPVGRVGGKKERGLGGPFGVRLLGSKGARRVKVADGC